MFTPAQTEPMWQEYRRDSNEVIARWTRFGQQCNELWLAGIVVVLTAVFNPFLVR